VIAQTASVVLRVSPFSSTSHIVTWLTPAYGRLSTVVKGACRPKSQFLGQYDIFYTCELLYYKRERNGIHIAKACSPIQTRQELRSDWRAFAHASYMCGLILRVSVPGGHHGEVFELAQTFLDHLCSRGAEPQVLFWFEQRLMGVLGMAPQLGKCAACDAAIAERRTTTFSAARGGLLCSTCSRGLPEQSIIKLPPDVRAILARWQGADSPHIAAATRCSPRQLLVIRRVLGIFLTYHLDVTPQCRAIALDIARSTDGRKTSTHDTLDRRRV